MHNISLDQYAVSVGRSEFVHGDWLMGLHFSSLKKDEQSPLHFWHFNYKLWWIFSYLQLLGDLVTDDDSSWATDVRATMKQRDRCKGRKESLGKETDALDPDEHFNVILFLCWGHRLRVLWGSGVTLHWRSCGELRKSFCNMLHRVILYCLRVITSYRKSRVFQH